MGSEMCIRDSGLAELGTDGLDALVPRVQPVVLDKAPTIGSGIF